jgi:hypothetical protein
MAEDLSAAPTGAETETTTASPAADAPEREETELPEGITSPDVEAAADGTEGETEAEPVEEIEFDFGGNKKKWAKGTPIEQIADELGQFTKGIWGDYTKKSQEVAESRKSLEAREQVVQKLSSLNDEALNTYSRGLAIKNELEQLSKIDMRALWQSNADQARQVSDTIAAKQAEFQQVVGRVSQLEGQMSQTQQQEVARRSDEGKQIVEKHIPGFATKHLPEVIDYVATYGISKEVAARDWPLNPATAVMAHKAMLYDRMQAQAKQAAKTPPKLPQQQPVPVVPPRGKGGPAVKSVRDMSVSEMAKHLGLRGG